MDKQSDRQTDRRTDGPDTTVNADTQEWPLHNNVAFPNISETYRVLSDTDSKLSNYIEPTVTNLFRMYKG